MLKIEQLEFGYVPDKGRPAENMSFTLDVEAGELLSVIGPSGSGKSTLLNLIAGFATPDSGVIRLNQREIQSLAAALRPVTMIFQDHNLFPHLDIFTNVAIGISPSLKLDEQQKSKIEAALASLGLSGYEKRKPGQLSGGQRQRVAIARALVRQHEILLLDEPFAALGPAQREEMIDMLTSLVKRFQMSAILVSHQPSDALLASTRTAFVDQGRVLKIAHTEQLLSESSEPEIRTYLGLR